MAPPVILTVTSPAAVGNQVVVTGTNFGFVSSCALVNDDTDEVINTPDFIVDSGVSLHLTVPRITPEGFYTVLLGTLDNEHSTNEAGSVNVILAPTYTWPEPEFPEAGTTTDSVRTRLRYELGDYTEGFSARVPGDGSSQRFELPAAAIREDSLVVVLDDGSTLNTLSPDDYVLDTKRGVITLDEAPDADETLYVRGDHNQFFTDAELDMFIMSAFYKHAHNATVRSVSRDPITGRAVYITDAETLANLPAVEEHPLALLATIEALWVLAADASYDIDVTTAEGTSLPRQERYRAIMQMIQAQQERYDMLSRQLNVGLNRLEMFTLRRVSRTTGRYVPVYQDREYDENNVPPMRVYPPVDRGVTGSGTTKRVHTGQQYYTGP